MGLQPFDQQIYESFNLIYDFLVFDQILLDPSVIIHVNPAILDPQLNAVGDEG